MEMTEWLNIFNIFNRESLKDFQKIMAEVAGEGVSRDCVWTGVGKTGGKQKPKKRMSQKPHVLFSLLLNQSCSSSLE